MATATVHPVHFEDYSGFQFERLVFAYHLRAGWTDLVWHGQSGSDHGRDIAGTEALDGQASRRTIIQCVNRDALSLKKATGDMEKAVTAASKIDAFKFVCRGNVSDTSRSQITKAAASLGIAHVTIWSGVEFEENLRLRAESLLRRFVEGVQFPDAEPELKSFVQQQDKSSPPIPKAILQRLNRAKALMDEDRFAAAVPILEKALTAADAVGHVDARVIVRCNLAQAVHEAYEDVARAETLYREGLVIATAKNHYLKHHVLQGMADMLFLSGRLEEARAAAHATLDHANQTKELDDLAASYVSLSLVEQALGEHDRSLDRLDEAIRLLHQRSLTLAGEEKQKNAHLLAVCYINKAHGLRDEGDSEQALTLYKKAKEQHSQAGDKLNAGKTYLYTGEVHCSKADWAKGFECFNKALELFGEVGSPLWRARGFEHLARFYAGRERWAEAWGAIQNALPEAEASTHAETHISVLLLAVSILRDLKRAVGRRRAEPVIAQRLTQLRAEGAENAIAHAAAEREAIHAAIEQELAEDENISGLRNLALEIARKEDFLECQANMLLEETGVLVKSDDPSARRTTIGQAITLLKAALEDAQSVRHRGDLMSRISALYQHVDDQVEAMSWLKRSGAVFERAGNIEGLANFHGSLAGLYREDDRVDDAIASYRKVLALIEGRHFPLIAARARHGLCEVLASRSENGEALKLLDAAEAICQKHHIELLLRHIGFTRSRIEKELQIAQAPKYTLPELLRSLQELVTYRPERSVAYLPFWYFAWNTQLLALLRSGPRLTFAVVCDDVNIFLRFAEACAHLGHHFLMATSEPRTVTVERDLLPIPPDWKTPETMQFILMRNKSPATDGGDGRPMFDTLPGDQWVGPARAIPLFTPCVVKSDGEERGHVLSQAPQHLPPQAIDLMLGQSIETLMRLRAMWLPGERASADDPFLYDLIGARDREMFPVYLERFPTSNAVKDCGGVRIAIPGSCEGDSLSSQSDRWSRALLKLARLPKDQAQRALLDLPEIFSGTAQGQAHAILVEVRLFEFTDNGKQFFRPALLIDPSGFALMPISVILDTSIDAISER